jgi:hypothetical protein
MTTADMPPLVSSRALAWADSAVSNFLTIAESEAPDEDENYRAHSSTTLCSFQHPSSWEFNPCTAVQALERSERAIHHRYGENAVDKARREARPARRVLSAS